jgi:hypothetical protein
MSFPLVGNPSESPLVKGVRGLFKERFWTSQNDRIEKLKQLLRSLMINSIKFMLLKGLKTINAFILI